MKKNKVKTTSSQLTHLFVSLFVAILILVNLAFMLISSAYIYNHAKDQSEEVIETVEENLDSKYNWSAMLDAYLAKQDDDAITLTTPQGRTYYSEDAHEIFKKISKQKHYKNMVFSKKHIYFLNQETHHDFTIRVALNIDELFELIIWLWIIIISLNLIAIFISIPLIRRLAHKWSRPIQLMNLEIQTIQESNNKKEKITVPSQPLEIKNLAISFNNLLTFQNNALKREQQFVSDASHELKTPIAAIRGHVNLIKRRGKSNPEVIEPSLKYIDSESKRMETLINELLTLGRIARNNEKIPSIDLVKPITEVVTEIQSVYPQEIYTSLPNKLEYPILNTSFRNIVHNLVENAAKYSPQNSDIHIYLTIENKHVILKVADHGIGISPENYDKIFDRFYREDNSHSSKIAGSGLGLAIVKAEVAKYYGEITVSANQPQGTIFTVSFPLEK